MISIIDSGGANISSILFCLERLGVSAQLTNDIESIKKSSHVILPGVGTAEMAMQRLSSNGLIPILQTLTQPVLGICLGMQLLFDFSDEGNVDCLKLISGKIKKINSADKLIVPHMGWNKLRIIRKHPLLTNIPDQAYSYFVHSYSAPTGQFSLAATSYGETFSSIVQHKNFYGTQFHPERSSHVGMQILKNFLGLL